MTEQLGTPVEAVRRSRSPESQPGRPAGPPSGGEFAVGGGRVGGKGKSSRRRRGGSSHTAAKKPAAPADPNLHFDGKSGTGYGIKGGDPRVRTLQQAINRLGLTDSHGQELAVDGRYGPRTTSAVKKLQAALGLPADGKVTPALLKQASELPQLPQKSARPAKASPAHRRTRRRRGLVSATVRSRILATVSRSLGEHRLVDGVCIVCDPDDDMEDDQADRALTAALDEIMRLRHVRTEAGAKKYGVPIGSVIGGGGRGPSAPHAPHAPVHPPSVKPAARDVQQDAAKLRKPTEAPSPKRATLKDRLVEAIGAHLKGEGDGDPLAGFNREQLRKVAKDRGIPLERGEAQDSIAKKILDHAAAGHRGDSSTRDTPKPVDAPDAPKRRPARQRAAAGEKAATPSAPKQAANRAEAARGTDALKAAPISNRQSLEKVTTHLKDFGSYKVEEDKPDIGGGVSGGEARNALGYYSDQGYQYVNDALRLAEGDATNLPATVRKGIPGHYTQARAEQMVRGIDALMGQSKLKRDVVVWRGVNDPAASMPGWNPDGDNVGLEFVDHAYASTTVNEAAARKFAGYGAGVKMNILVPAGTGAVGIQNSQSGLRNERELLLQRGLRYRVVQDRVVDGVRTIDVDVIPAS